MTAGTCTVYFTSHTFTSWALRESKAVSKKNTKHVRLTHRNIVFTFNIWQTHKTWNFQKIEKKEIIK